MPSEEATRRLQEHVASVGRGLTARAASFAALAGGAVATGATIALSTSPVTSGVAVTVCAVTGAALGIRGTRGARLVDAAGWLDRRADRVELVVSGTAVADGRALRTALADAVIDAAASRVHRIGRPSPLPSLAALAALVALVAATTSWPRHRPEHPTATARAPDTTDRPTMIVGHDRGPLAATPGARAQDAPADELRSPDRAADEETTIAGASPGAHLAGRGTDATGVGASAGAILDREPVIAPATTSTRLDVGAPPAGASPELIAVPSRYRALVAAYLEAR